LNCGYPIYSGARDGFPQGYNGRRRIIKSSRSTGYWRRSVRFPIQLIHKRQIIRIHLLLILNPLRTLLPCRHRHTILPNNPLLRTIPRWMTSIPTNRTLNRNKILLPPRKPLGTLKSPMPLLRTQLTKLLILQRPIQQGQLPQLLLLVHILIIINNHQHLLHHIRRRIHIPLIIPRNHHMQLLIIPIHHLPIPPPPRPLLHTPLPSYRNLTPRFILHFLLRLAPWAYNKTNEIVGGMFFDGYGYFTGSFASEEGGCDGGGVLVGGEGGEGEDLFEGVLALGGVAFAPADCPGVAAFSVCSVDWRWTRTPIHMPHRQRIHLTRLPLQINQPLIRLPQFLLQIPQLLHLLRTQISRQTGQQIQNGRWRHAHTRKGWWGEGSIDWLGGFVTAACPAGFTSFGGFGGGGGGWWWFDCPAASSFACIWYTRFWIGCWSRHGGCIRGTNGGGGGGCGSIGTNGNDCSSWFATIQCS